MRRVVYVIRSGESTCYKIGITNSVKSRLDALQSGNPERLTVDFVISPQDRKTETQEIETKLHRVLNEHKIHGEWFRFDTPLDYDAMQVLIDKIGFSISKERNATLYVERTKRQNSAFDKLQADIVNFLKSNRPMRVVEIHKGINQSMVEITAAIYDLSALGVVKRQRIDRLDHWYFVSEHERKAQQG